VTELAKVDLRAENPGLYAPEPGIFTLVTVPGMRFLGADGRGDPDTSPGYAAAVAALYAASYAAKFSSKKDLGRDYVVLPLEGLWRSSDGNFRDRSTWDWTMLIRQPDWLDADRLRNAIATAAEKGHTGAGIRVIDYEEGLSVQTLHLGSYDSEAPTIARLHDEFLPSEGLVETGDHHEIYLNDPRRVAPEKLRTILRQPVRRRDG
jgi:hypothetical protein